MRARARKIPSALKHGAYTVLDVLPGEDSAKFSKLHRNLIAELAPTGPLEQDIVATIARLVWRKQNRATLHMPNGVDEPSSESPEEVYRRMTGKEKKNSGGASDAVVAAKLYTRIVSGPGPLAGNSASTPYDDLNKDLEIEDRFGVLIDKCLKRLLFLRGLKSISSTSPAPPPERLAGP